MVKVIFSIEARHDIKSLDHFYNRSPRKAQTIRKKISEGVNTLQTFPKAGPVEIHFEDRSVTYRSLVIDKDFKLIYYIEEEIIYIVGIWDCRQDPLKIFDRLYPSC